jgi:hypothetical protein
VLVSRAPLIVIAMTGKLASTTAAKRQPTNVLSTLIAPPGNAVKTDAVSTMNRAAVATPIVWVSNNAGTARV